MKRVLARNKRAYWARLLRASTRFMRVSVTSVRYNNKLITVLMRLIPIITNTNRNF